MGLAVIVAALVVGALAPAAGAASEKIERTQIVRLLASIPKSYRAGCQIWSTPATEPAIGPQKSHVIAELRCFPGGGADVAFYTQFDDAAAMNAAFDGYNPQPGDGEQCPGSGTWDQDGVDAGRWSCYLADTNGDKDATVVWTHDDSNVLASAYRYDEDLAALDDWWSSDEAGPLAEPDRAGLPKVQSTTQWLANGKALERVVPSSHHDSCRPIPLTSDGLGESLYPVRMWLAGAVECSAGEKPVSYYRFVPGAAGTAAMNVFFTRQADGYVDEADARDQLGTFSCEGRGTWSRRNREVGEYGCWHSTDEHGEYAEMEWTDTTQNVLGYASIAGADATPLLKFWKNDAGPLAAR